MRKRFFSSDELSQGSAELGALAVTSPPFPPPILSLLPLSASRLIIGQGEGLLRLASIDWHLPLPGSPWLSTQPCRGGWMPKPRFSDPRKTWASTDTHLEWCPQPRARTAYEKPGVGKKPAACSRCLLSFEDRFLRSFWALLSGMAAGTGAAPSPSMLPFLEPLACGKWNTGTGAETTDPFSVFSGSVSQRRSTSQ